MANRNRRRRSHLLFGWTRTPGTWRAVTALLVACCFGVLGWWVWSTEALRVQRVEVVGAVRLDPETLRMQAHVRLGQHYFLVPVGEIRRQLRANPLVKEVSVSRKWGGTLLITVQERAPLAAVCLSGGFAEVDEDGVVVGVRSHWREGHSLPVITGLDFQTYAIGQALPAEGLDWALRVVGLMQPRWREQLGEVHVRGETLTLYFRGGTAVFLGEADAQLPDRIATLEAILEDAVQSGLTLAWVDLRYRGKPVVKPRPP